MNRVEKITMKLKFPKKSAKQLFAICALVFFIALSIPIVVYAAKMKGGAEVANSCALKNAGSSGAINACITGGCMALYLNDSIKRRACVSNANQQLKKLNSHKR